MKKTKASCLCSFAILAASSLASTVFADDPAVGGAGAAEARFRGTGKADPIRIENVRRADGSAAGQSAITFDLAWDHSWRAAWEVSEQQHGGKGTLKLESWDAAWVFVKVREGSEGPWSHAMLATNRTDHQVPAAAVLDVGMTDDGKRGIGVFVYRKTAGSGPNVFKDVTLRWQHPPTPAGAGSGATSPSATGDAPFDAAKAELRVFAIQMVRVPECAFWVGDGFTNRVNAQFSTGGGTQPFRIESEEPLALGGDTPEKLNNRDGVGMFEGMGDDFHSDIPRTIPAAFPKGSRAFYCMRHEITVRQYVDFLNTLSYAGQRERTEPQGKDRLGPEAPTGTVVMTSSKAEAGRTRIAIAIPGVRDGSEAVAIQREGFTASTSVFNPGKPAVYETDTPNLPCNSIRNLDGLAYAAWAGLRPMTELEFEKACRGPLKPVPDEYAWGTAQIAGMEPESGGYVYQNAGKPDETVVWEGKNAPGATHGNAPNWLTNQKIGGPLRVGIFATPTSDRVSAGASYWGILDLTGNLMECLVPVSNPAARAFRGNHGDGGNSPWGNTGFGMRGGGYGDGKSHYNGFGGWAFQVSNRYAAGAPGPYSNARHYFTGFRCVRTAP